jgi:tight adherence protein B
MMPIGALLALALVLNWPRRPPPAVRLRAVLNGRASARTEGQPVGAAVHPSAPSPDRWLGGVRRAVTWRWPVAGALVALAPVSGRPVLVGISAAAVALGGSGALGRWERRRVAAAAHQHERTALAILSAELAAGSREADALAAAGAAEPRWADGEVVQAAAVAARRGDDICEVLDRAPALRDLATAWRVRAATGAALADVVSRVERDRADHARRGRDVAAALAGPRASALVLALLPVLGIGLGTAMGAQPLALLTGTAAGSALLLAGVGLDALGLVWMRRLAAAAEIR